MTGLLPSSSATEFPDPTDAPNTPRLPWLFMLPGDIGLFLRSAKTDARIAQARLSGGARAAFEAEYDGSSDPWCSESAKYRYQSMKYDRLMALLPRRRFTRALDLGCGAGLLTRRLAARADRVLGVDLASSAIAHARSRNAGTLNMEFMQGDVLDLPPSIGPGFDLIVVADVLYYLSPLDDAVLRTLIQRIASLLTPGGICLLANHYFFAADRESRLSRRIHIAFAAFPGMTLVAEHRRAFFLASVLTV